MSEGAVVDDASRARPSAAARLLLLRERFGWMGRHSGYDIVFEGIEKTWPGPVESVFRTRSTLRAIALAPVVWALRPRTPFYDGDSLVAELRARRIAASQEVGLAHVAFVENNLRLLARSRPRDLRLVGTAHQPVAWWQTRHRHPALVEGLDALIVMCRAQQAYFEEVGMAGRVHFVPHGVDTDFFSPGDPPASAESDTIRCLFAGVWMRDLEALEFVVERASACRPRVRFDFIVPRDRRRASPALRRLGRHERVHWHGDLSDEALRDLYRSARLLLMPLLDATANNALLEASACGLPLVTTMVGGVPDYTDSSFADCVGPADRDALLDAVLRLVDDDAEAARRGRAARAYAEAELAWPRVVEETTALYEKLLP